MQKLSRVIQNEIRSHANKNSALFAQRFFKTGPGQYGEGDVFLGLTVPKTRKLVKKYLKLITLKDLSEIIKSKYHEERLFALASLAELSKKAYKATGGLNHKKLLREYKSFYFKNIRYINSWDLIDVTAEHVVGSYYFDTSKSDLIKLAKSKNLWKKRIAIISTFYFIRRSEFQSTIEICKILLADKHDLIHKATGWMLREVGKRDKKTLIKFLNQHAYQMPRTMLRYSLEKLSATEKRKYMKK